MKYNLIVFLTFLCGFQQIYSQSQSTGEIEFIMYVRSNIPHLCLLKHQDSVVQKCLHEEYSYFKDLVPNVYSIEIYRKDRKIISVDNIVVLPDSATYVECEYPDIYYLEKIDTTQTTKDAVDYYLSLVHSPTEISPKELINFGNQVRFGFISYPYYKKHFSFGIIFGILQFNQTRFLKDTSMFMPADHQNELYSYLSVPMGITTRFGINDLTKNIHKRVVVDAGVIYSFPYWFRHSFRDGNQATITKKLHNYKDFTAICNIGFTPFTLTAEYRLTDFIKSDFPQLPRFKLGINFLFHFDDY